MILIEGDILNERCLKLFIGKAACGENNETVPNAVIHFDLILELINQRTHVL